MKLFLKLRAWQLFLLIIAPMVLPMFLMQGPEGFRLFGFVTLVWMLVVIGWLYSVGSEYNSRLPDNLWKETVLFKLGFLVPVIYALIMAFIIFPSFASFEAQTEQQPFPVWVLPLHFGSMVGMIYGLWFTAKQFATFQKGETVTFLEYSGPFFLFWFSPIGVWFLQPKINEISDSEA